MKNITVTTSISQKWKEYFQAEIDYLNNNQKICRANLLADRIQICTAQFGKESASMDITESDIWNKGVSRQLKTFIKSLTDTDSPVALSVN